MARLTLTLDSSVVIDALNGDQWAVALLDRAREGDIDVAVTTRVSHEVTKQPIPDWMATLLGEPLGTPARLDVSRWGGGDYFAGAEQTNIGGLDGDHVEGHIRAGRDLFVTSDLPLLKRARARGVASLTPAEVLARYPKAG